MHSTILLASLLTGHWTMHLHLGAKVFEDDVVLTESGGTLTVPDRFSAAIEHLQQRGDQFSFDITADEGHGPFHVRYAGTLHPAGDTFIGFATVTDDGSLLGGFVGQRVVASKPH